jgi:hypothetical protein
MRIELILPKEEKWRYLTDRSGRLLIEIEKLLYNRLGVTPTKIVIEWDE